MKKHKIMKIKYNSFLICTFFIGCCFITTLTGCESTTTVEDYVGTPSSAPYDPSAPVTVKSFTPTSGSVGQQVCIQGSNFGNDSSIVNVTIGGKSATVVSVKSNAIYCYLPGAAYDHIEGSHLFATVQVSVGGKGQKEQTGKAQDMFEYERKTATFNASQNLWRCRHTVFSQYTIGEMPGNQSSPRYGIY